MEFLLERRTRLGATGIGEEGHVLFKLLRIRTSSFDRLAQLKNGLLTKLLIEGMKTDPIAPVLHKKHIEAINRRMPIIFQHIQQCVNRFVKLRHHFVIIT